MKAKNFLKAWISLIGFIVAAALLAKGGAGLLIYMDHKGWLVEGMVTIGLAVTAFGAWWIAKDDE